MEAVWTQNIKIKNGNRFALYTACTTFAEMCIPKSITQTNIKT